MELIYIGILVLSICMSCAAVNFGFTPGRRWYVGGDFSSVIKGDASSMTANNFAYFDGSEWYTMGEGTNGPVHTIHVDICYNVYLGGSFTKAFGIDSGPIIKYDYFKQEWKAVTQMSNYQNFVQNDTTIKAITTNCAKISGFCMCDVYVGGKFQMSDGTETAVNVAHMEATSEGFTLKGLGGAANHGFSVNGTVNALYKKNWGATAAINYLWVGGDMGNGQYFGRFHLNELNSKYYDFSTSDGTVNGVVKAFNYKPRTIGFTDELYVVGDFNFNGKANAAKCQYVCWFNHAEKVWITLGDESGHTLPNGPVNTLGMNGNTVFVGGNFTNGLLKTSGSGYTLNDPNQSSNIGSTQVTSISVCGDYDLSCKGSSVAVAGTNNFLKFFNTKKEQWEPFNGGTNGQVHTVYTNFQWRGNTEK